MKKISIYSLIIGVGLGIIISSIFNIIWIQLDHINLKDQESAFQQVANNTNIKNEIKYHNNDKIITFENSNDTYNEIYISKGMLSEEIADLLENKGIIESSQEFNDLASRLKITKKFQYGLKTIPKNSSLDEIMLILTK